MTTGVLTIIGRPATITSADKTEAGNAEEQPARDNQQGATDERLCGSLRIPTARSKTHPSLPKCLKKPPCRRQEKSLNNEVDLSDSR